MSEKEIEAHQKEIEAYLKDPNHCPKCGSDQLRPDCLENDGKDAWVKIACLNCNETRSYIYTLTDVVITPLIT